MKKINIKTFKTSELNIDFSNINEICIEDNAFDEGAFGKIYTCISINNNTNLGKSQAVKIFETDGEVAKLSFQTIQTLQNKIIEYNMLVKNNPKKKSIQDVPALKALPQFSFEGTINGKSIFGYSAHFLSNTEYMLFDNIFNDTDLDRRIAYKKQYYNKPIEDKLQHIFSLSEGINILQNELYFIHADLNPKNIFLHTNKNECIIIDYESGAVTDSTQKEALVFGKMGEFLAPEIYEQLINLKKGNKIKVKYTSDNWALAVINHYLLFPAHPLFFLIDAKSTIIEDYLRYYKFPEINPNYAYFNKTYKSQYQKYKEYFGELDDLVQKAFIQTITNGWAKPEQRLTPSHWENMIKRLTTKDKVITPKTKILQKPNTTSIQKTIVNTPQKSNIIPTQNIENKDIENQKNELNQLKKENQKMKKEIENANKTIKRLQSESQREKNTIQYFQNRCAKNDNDLSKAENEINILKSQIEIKDSFLDKLKINKNTLLIIIIIGIAIVFYNFKDYFINNYPRELKVEEGVEKTENSEETNILQMIEDEKKEFEKQKEKYINSSTKPNADTIRLQTFLEYTNLNIGGVEADIYDYKNKHNDLNILKTNFEKRKKEQDSLFAIFNQLP